MASMPLPWPICWSDGPDAPQPAAAVNHAPEAGSIVKAGVLMKQGGLRRTIPPAALKGDLQLTDVDALLRGYGASIRSVDNHHWQISSGDRSGLWLLGDRAEGGGGCLDQASLQRLQRVLRHTGLLRGQGQSDPGGTPMGAAILWVGNEATRVYWINDRDLAEGGSHALSHWLHGEITLHNNRRLLPYLRRVVAMLERLTQLLDEERPDLRKRLVGVLSLDRERLDDALLFAMACDYLLPQGGWAHRSAEGPSGAQEDPAGCCGP